MQIDKKLLRRLFLLAAGCLVWERSRRFCRVVSTHRIFLQGMSADVSRKDTESKAGKEIWN